MESFKFFELINYYGFPLVAFVVLAIWLKPKADKLFDVALRLDEEEKRKRRYPSRMMRVMDINEQVMDILRALLVEFESSRIMVYSYHNGGHNITGLDFARCSCTHEVVSLGTRPLQPIYQNLPVTMFCAFNRRVLSGDGVRCASVDCFKEIDPSTYETLKVQGTLSVYCVGLYAHNGLPIGYLTVDYSDDYYEMTSDQFDDLKDLASRVATLLCMCGNDICALEEK